MADAGQLRVPIAKAFPLDQLADAHRLVAERHVRGKVVVTPAEWPCSRRSTTPTSRGTGGSWGCPGWSTCTCTSCPSGCRPRSGSTSPTPRRTTGRRGRSATRCRCRRAARRPGALGVRAFPTLPYPHKAGHGRLAQRPGGRLRPGAPAGAARRRPSTPSRRRRPTSPRRWTPARGCSRCTCRSATSTRGDELLDAGVGAAGADRDAGGHPLRLRSAARRAHRPGADGRPAGAVPAAAAGHRAPRDARVRRVPGAGRALRAGAPGHHDVRHRLHRAADALRPRAAAPAGRAAGQGVLGSDFPTIPYPYAHQLAALHRLGLGEDWLRAVLWENGARLFGRGGA